MKALRLYLSLTAAFLAVLAGSARAERLYNGINLPRPWPPKTYTTAMMKKKEPVPLPPYLKRPPSTIYIDVGRQLFVDDFLIKSSSLKRTYHLPELHPNNPVANGMPFSGGLFWDPDAKTFKRWYHYSGTGYGTSPDGISWKHHGTVLKPKTDSQAAWLDLDTDDPSQRYKLIRSTKGSGGKGGRFHGKLFYSGNGIKWSHVRDTPTWGDRSTMFYNPFRKVWVFGIASGGGGRARRYWEVKDMKKDRLWGWNGKDGKGNSQRPVNWAWADKLDKPRPELKIPTQLYNLDAAAYESIMLGMFTVWHGDTRKGKVPRGKPQEWQKIQRPKLNLVKVGYSRDGFHWYRPDRRPFFPNSEENGAWNWGNVQSVGGLCVVVKDKIYLYCCGRGAVNGGKGHRTWNMGLGVLRRDGFASMDAGNREGSLTTRRVRFKGKYLYVNVDADEGEFRAEVTQGWGRAKEPFTKANCKVISVDSTIKRVEWEGVEDLSELAGKNVQFRFYLKNGKFYSFWVSPDENGASHGYVGGGGLNWTGPTDTVGIDAYGIKPKPKPEEPVVEEQPGEEEEAPIIEEDEEPDDADDTAAEPEDPPAPAVDETELKKKLKLAATYTRNKMYQKARVIYKEIIDQHPESESADEARTRLGLIAGKRDGT